MTTDKYWENFIEENPDYKDKAYEAWQFGEDPDTLAELVVQGTKTLTCSSLREYQVENEPLPEVGDVSIILDAADQPKCVIENMKVYTMKFSDVDADIAYKEGEGDRTLAYWRKSHLEFFEWLYEKLGHEFSESEEIVVEEFRVIYK
ncbi:MAG TPA: ASCH domain-containing protein [Aliicoccus persicus]|uniref:ASCH domain-containing protein n=1 Tax=Aliicoccus persicus TaxID=930138 RepID=A0A921DYI3_9STAP|nr:ASCH domain-containing protein [Aliicoccus persicus]